MYDNTENIYWTIGDHYGPCVLFQNNFTKAIYNRNTVSSTILLHHLWCRYRPNLEIVITVVIDYNT